MLRAETVRGSSSHRKRGRLPLPARGRCRSRGFWPPQEIRRFWFAGSPGTDRRPQELHWGESWSCCEMRLTHYNAHFAWLASGFTLWACGLSPPGVSQAPNPTLEALGLRRHKTGVMKGMSQDGNALHGGKQVHGKGAGVFPLPECPKLALDPSQVLSEDLGRSGGDRAARLVELGAKRPDSAAELCQAILVLEDALDAGAKPILGRPSFVPSLPLRGQLRQPQLDDRLANLVLGLEVIIDVTERNLGFARDVGKRGGLEPVLVRQFHCRAKQPRSLVDICSSHVHKSVN